MSLRSYTTLDEVRRLIGRRASGGSISGGIWIGTTSTSHMGTTDANAFIDEAELFIDGMLFHKYDTPFSSPVPYEIRWIARHLAAGNIVQTARQYVADSASNFLFDKQMINYYKAMNKLEALRDGLEILRGVIIESLPDASVSKQDDFIFAMPGSSNVRPQVGL